MNKLSATMLAAFSLLFCLATNSYAGEIQLPQKFPELKTTSQQQLGTLDQKHGLAPGQKVGNFKIKDHFGKTTKFKTLRKDAPLLVIFYRGGWCPYCNLQIVQLTKAWPEFKKRGVTPVLISADKPDAAALASRTYEIPFPVLSDPTLIAHEAFNVVMSLDEETVKKYEQYGIFLSDWSGEAHNKFAISSAFLINKKGVIDWSHSSLDYATRPSVEQLLTVIDMQ